MIIIILPAVEYSYFFFCLAPPDSPALPPSTLPADEQLNSDIQTVTISVPTFSTSNGEISHYQVIVVFLPEGTEVNSLSKPDELFNSINSLSVYGSVPCGNQPSTIVGYITAEMSSTLYDGLNGKFVVGQDKDSDPNSANDRPELYTNGPLCYSTRYTVFVRAYPVTRNQQVILPSVLTVTALYRE